MKKTLIIIMAAFALCGVSRQANAQTADAYVRVGAGAGIYQGEEDAWLYALNRFSPTGTVTAGLWLSPTWGVRGSVYGGMIMAAGAGETPYTTGEYAPSIFKRQKPYKVGDYTLMGEQFNYFTLSPEVTYNFSNGLCGYNPQRIWTVTGHVGPHYSFSWENGYHRHSLGAQGGVNSAWRIGDAMDFWGDITYTVYGKKFDMVDYRGSLDGMAIFTVGITFYIGQDHYLRSRSHTTGEAVYNAARVHDHSSRETTKSE